MAFKKANQEPVKKYTGEVATLEKPKEDKVKEEQKNTKPTGNTTRITIKFDVGFGNNLFIRGQGAPGLSWTKGIQLKNIKANEWVWESNTSFAGAEFKVLVNDKTFETGPNHSLKCGANVQYTPRF